MSGMSTDTFREFLEKQEFDRQKTRELAEKIDLLQRDVAQMHESRHATQNRLSEVVNEIRMEHSGLEEQVEKLVTSMRDLVVAMEGKFGSKGLISRVETVEASVARHEAMLQEGRGMQRLITWGSATIATLAAIKAFFVK